MTQLTKNQVETILNNAPAGTDKTSILDGLITRGYELEGVDTAAAKATIAKKAAAAGPTKPTFDEATAETTADLKQIGTEVKSGLDKRKAKIQESQDARDMGEQGGFRTGLQNLGQVLGFGADTIEAATKGVVKALLPQKNEDKVKENLGLLYNNPVVKPLVDKIPVEELSQKFNQWKIDNPEKARDLDALSGFAEFAANFVGAGGAKAGTEAATQVAENAGSAIAKTAGDAAASVSKAAGDVVGTVADAANASGVGQIATEMASRIPRAASRAKEAIGEAAARAETMKTATPAVRNAIVNKVDKRIINTITEADEATRKAYSDVVALAEESPNKIGMKKQPSIVSGDLASKQFDVINAEKKKIGQALGDEAKKLSKTTKVNMQDAYKTMDDTLAEQGITPQYTKKGVKLDFKGSRFTPAERTKIQELYNLTTEGGDNLTPSKIRDADQLFSKLKREANYEGVGNIIMDTPDGPKSMFNVFRDIYSSKLDTVSPEIKALNSSYSKIKNITDDIEDSIFKTPDFNVTQHVDPAEFAKVNLRRIFGEAQSSPVYEAIADIMDSTSRGLGYKGASPKSVAEFAQEMRKLFPDTIPKTGFSGGIKMGVGDIVEKISSVGAANLTDQQKAVRDLLDSMAKTAKKTVKKK